MAWRRARAQVRTVAERRLAAVARQWRPVPDPAVTGGSAPDQPDAGPWQWPEPEHLPRGGPRLAAWGRPALRGLALLVVLAVALAGYGAWSGRPRAVAQAPEVLAVGTPLPSAASPVPPPEATPAVPATTPASPPALPDVVVHVAGLVARPGLVRLPAGSRVADAVDAAGGVTRRRAADSVNLARMLVDGEQVVVSDAPAVGTTAATGTAAAAPTPIDLNTATVESFDGLPGIGPVIAARIVAWRTANGAFRSVDELGEVSGIGDAILTQVRPLVRV